MSSMGNANSDSGWHTFPDYPDTWEDVETVYEVVEDYDSWVSHTATWSHETYVNLCLWDWENHRFMDVFDGEYFYDIGTCNEYRDYKLFWRVADLPPGMEKYGDTLYSELCRHGVEPFYVPERPPYTQDEIEDMINERRWEERNGR